MRQSARRRTGHPTGERATMSTRSLPAWVVLATSRLRAAVGACPATFAIIPVGRAEPERADAMAGGDLEEDPVLLRSPAE
jgi:hypothetical protein